MHMIVKFAQCTFLLTNAYIQNSEAVGTRENNDQVSIVNTKT